MSFPRLLLAAGLAGALLGCQAPPANTAGDDLPHSNPTQTSTGLADGK